MVTKKEILNDAWKYLDKIQGMFPEEKKPELDLARRARRAIGLILSQGITDTLLFGYSKCGNDLVERIYRSFSEDKEVNLNEKRPEVLEWALVINFLLNYPLRRLGFVTQDNISLKELLRRLLNEKDVARIVKLEKLSIQYLMALTRLWQSMFGGGE